jgi:hypothetical protein
MSNAEMRINAAQLHQEIYTETTRVGAEIRNSGDRHLHSVPPRAGTGRNDTPVGRSVQDTYRWRGVALLMSTRVCGNANYKESGGEMGERRRRDHQA